MVSNEVAIPVVIPFVVSYPQGVPSMLVAARLKDGFVTTPGGRIKTGESARRAVRREIREETSLRVSLNEILTVSQEPIFATVESGRIAASTFLVYYKLRHGKPRTMEPQKHSKWVWAPIEEIDAELAHHWLFPYEVFFTGHWQERMYKRGQRLAIL